MKQLNKKEIKKAFKKIEKRHLEVYVLLENIQYASNVASMFRTADAAGVKKIILTGITTTPPFGKDLQKASRKKEGSVQWVYRKTSGKIIPILQKEGFVIVAIEITDKSKPIGMLDSYITGKDKVCFVLGSEVNGIHKNTLPRCDSAFYIPMYGKGASLNVSASLAIALYSFGMQATG